MAEKEAAPTAPAPGVTQPVVVEGRPFVPAAEPSAATRPFRFKGNADGGKHFQDGKQVKVGDVVQLTAAQAAAFADRFELENPPKEEKKVEPLPAVAVGVTPAVPQDIGAKTSVGAEKLLAEFKTDDEKKAAAAAAEKK